MAWINVYSGKKELVMTSKFLRKLIGMDLDGSHPAGKDLVKIGYL